jgi:hypothetical protein
MSTDGRIDDVTGSGVTFSPWTGEPPPEPLTWRRSPLSWRIAGIVVAFGVGVAIGALTTVSHGAGVEVAGASVPVGLIGGLAVIAVILAGLRILVATRLVTIAGALGVLGSIALLSLESAGGSVLVPASPVAYWWVYGPPVIAAVVLAWPRVGPRTRGRIGASSAPEGPEIP